MTDRNLAGTVLTLAVVVTASLALTTTSANAALFVEEQFIYDAGVNIGGLDGGTGFDGPWVSTISHGRIYEIQTTGLEFSTLPVDGNSLSRYGSSGRAEAHRLISVESRVFLTGDDTTMWFSTLFQEPNSQYKHGSFLFGSDGFTTGGTPTLSAAGEGFGFTIQAAPDGSAQGNGTINAIAFDSDTAPTVVAGAYTPNPIDATSLIVGKINWKADGTADELFLFNVTDLSTEPPEESAIVSITDLDFTQSAFDTVAMWDSNNAITDEIRFGTTYRDVTGNPAPPPSLTLKVNTVTGATTLLGDSSEAIDINFYEITSDLDSLDATNWSSLADQDYEGSGPPNGSGNGWQEAGGVGSHALAEGFLLGTTTIGVDQSLGLGYGYDVGVGSEDLEFKYSIDTGAILEGLVQYVGCEHPPADFDCDGDFDTDDLDALTAVGNLAAGVAVSPANAKFDLNGDNTINSADLDQWLANAATSNGYGAPYFKGDANLDADVDVWDFDGSGDAQALSSNIGGPFPDGHDVGAEEAEAIYNPATGELFFDVGADVSVVGIGSAVMFPGNVNTGSIFGTPVQNNGTSLAFFNAGGLPVGEDSLGLALPAGLTQEDMTFSYTPFGGDTTEVPATLIAAVWSDGDFNGDGDVDAWDVDGSGDAQILSANLGSIITDVAGPNTYVPVTMIVPEPSTITMLVVLGLIGVCSRRRRP